MMNIILKRQATIASIIATSLISIASPAPAASPISFIDIPIDSIVNANKGQHKDPDERSQLLVKQRHRDHEMFIVRTPDCRFMRYTRIWSLDVRGKSSRQLFPIGQLQGLDRCH
ncbi:MAG: hypothetical protein HC789_04660 [Microcoleus sp. CSU_2_2]|nr:hypothetical protein [Microcoleus sp. SU_5_3]NJS09717.1 hypothetical protein [Microcoleus sp. CSU_2_2]